MITVMTKTPIPFSLSVENEPFSFYTSLFQFASQTEAYALLFGKKYPSDSLEDKTLFKIFFLFSPGRETFTSSDISCWPRLAFH